MYELPRTMSCNLNGMAAQLYAYVRQGFERQNRIAPVWIDID